MELFGNFIKIRGTFCIEEIPKPTGFVIFGASGDLTFRKLIPSLFGLYEKNLLPSAFFIIGTARSSLNDETFREKIQDAILAKNKSSYISNIKSFLEKCYYVSGDYNDISLYNSIKKKLENLDKKSKVKISHVFYMATPPHVYKIIIKHLGLSRLTKENTKLVENVRVVVEKPYGHDLESAMDLDRTLKSVLNESQIYRIDHYLGKETVQNILLFRFANSIFEPIWNRNYIEDVQITVAESIGIEHRAGYFEKAGLLRDMFQNHMLQMLSLVAMEPPISFNADRVRDEKVKLLRSIRPFTKETIKKDIVRAQYAGGIIDGVEVPAYREEEKVDPKSTIETFIAMKIMIDNWRWNGVPFYLRAGKRLAKKASKIVIRFKMVPHSMFSPLTPEDLESNILIFHVQPDEGISLRILAKHPGPKLCMDSLEMDFQYKDVVKGELPEAYERLLLDCMLGDQTLFIRHDDMEVSWTLFTPILKLWEKDLEGKESSKLLFYPSGSWGPKESEEILKRDGKKWIRI